MAIEAKVSFLNHLENKLRTTTTADMMTKFLSTVSDVMEHYDLHEIPCEEMHDDLLQCYLDAMAVQGRSEKTIANYKIVLQKMLKGVNVSVRSITVYHLRRYLGEIKAARNLMDSTLEGYRSIYCAFFRWLYREALISRNPADVCDEHGQARDADPNDRKIDGTRQGGDHHDVCGALQRGHEIRLPSLLRELTAPG